MSFLKYKYIYYGMSLYLIFFNTVYKYVLYVMFNSPLNVIALCYDLLWYLAPLLF